jgi:hypothetical protein
VLILAAFPGAPIVLSLVAIDMGYGHLRAAQPLADVLRLPMLELDQPPLAEERDVKAWARARAFHEGLSRASQWPLAGAPFLLLMDAYTHIDELYPERDLSTPALGSRGLRRLIDRGLGGGLVRHLRDSGDILITTFYAPALIADAAGLPSYCLVTDADCHRIWVADDPEKSRIRYLAPSRRVVRRLLAYGVPPERIALTGFPLPVELLGGGELPALRANLAARIARLDPEKRFRAQHASELASQLPPTPAGATERPPLVVFAIGGAGAQRSLAHDIVRSLAPSIRAGKLRLALVAGLRRALADAFASWADQLSLGPGLEIVFADSWIAYYRRFNEVLARADVLWTKPSEMTFYGGLGLPLVLAPPVGAHERYNARWAEENGAGLPQLDPRRCEGWLLEWIEDGVLAAAAWAGFRHLPSRGTYDIAEWVTSSRAAEAAGTPG